METKPRVNVQIRLQSEEQKRFYQNEAKKKGLSLSEYFRQCADGSPGFTIREYEREVKRAIYEIHRIGVNLNQIAKKYNQNLYLEPSEEVIREAEKVVEVAEHMLDFLKANQRKR